LKARSLLWAWRPW